MSETYQTSLYRQTCTCPAGQYGRWCKHLTALADQQTADDAKIAAARARWATAEASVRRARAAELARSRWAATYPGTD